MLEGSGRTGMVVSSGIVIVICDGSMLLLCVWVAEVMENVVWHEISSSLSLEVEIVGVEAVGSVVVGCSVAQVECRHSEKVTRSRLQAVGSCCWSFPRCYQIG